MFSTGFLTGALALLCLIGIIVSIVKHRLNKDEKGKSSDLQGVFFAIGFLPMIFMTLSSFRSYSASLTQFFACIRNPFLSFEFTLNAVTGLSEFSFVLDFFTAIIFGSTVAITLSGDLDHRQLSDHVSGGAGRGDVVYGVLDPEHKEVSVSYLRFCRIRS